MERQEIFITEGLYKDVQWLARRVSAQVAQLFLFHHLKPRFKVPVVGWEMTKTNLKYLPKNYICATSIQ